MQAIFAPVRLAISFLLVNVVIFIHELGHWTVARLCGIPIAVFSIGFGSKYWTIGTWCGTQWRLSAIPLGGYVQYGEIGAVIDNPKELMSRFPAWKRLLVTAGGPAFNLLLTLGILWVFYMQAGGTPVQSMVAASERLGHLIGLFGMALLALAHIVSLPGVSGANVSGVVGIVGMGQTLLSQGVFGAANFVGTLSFNLGMANLLPLPILDGGGIVLLTIEAIRGKPLSDRSERLLVRVGLALLACLFLWGFTNDMISLWRSGEESLVLVILSGIAGMALGQLRQHSQVWRGEGGSLSLNLVLGTTDEEMSALTRELSVFKRPLVRLWKTDDGQRTIELVVRRGSNH